MNFALTYVKFCDVGMFLMWKTTDPSSFIRRLLCSFRNDIDCWWRKCIQAICLLYLAIPIWYTASTLSYVDDETQISEMKYLFENLLPKTNWFILRLPIFPFNHDCKHFILWENPVVIRLHLIPKITICVE
jgi:hypothetical protein